MEDAAGERYGGSKRRRCIAGAEDPMVQKWAQFLPNCTKRAEDAPFLIGKDQKRAGLF